MRAVELGVIEAVMSSTAELLAARGGTMTAERFADLKAHAEDSPGWFAEQADELLGHMEAQGARIAALEAELAKDDVVGAAEYSRHREDVITLTQRVSDLEAEKTSTNGGMWKAAAQQCSEDRQGLIQRASELEQHISDLEKSLENARKERDEAAAELRRTDNETMQIVTRVTDECEAVLADNAALTVELRSLFAVLWGPDFERRPAEAAAQRVLAKFHPGDALLKRMKRLEEALSAIHGEVERHSSEQERSTMDTVAEIERIASEALAGRFSHPAGPAVIEQLRRLETALRRVASLVEAMSPDTMAGAVQTIIAAALDGTQPDPVSERMKRLEERAAALLVVVEQIALENVHNPYRFARESLEKLGH
jgi:predicted  nucleic acid-binding Zn-ribbon protein